LFDSMMAYSGEYRIEGEGKFVTTTWGDWGADDRPKKCRYRDA